MNILDRSLAPHHPNGEMEESQLQYYGRYVYIEVTVSCQKRSRVDINIISTSTLVQKPLSQNAGVLGKDHLIEC